MKLLNDWISESLLKALGWTLVHSIWQLILIAAVLWIVLKLVHRALPALKYGLAVGALVLSFGAVFCTFLYEIEAEKASTPVFHSGNFDVIFNTSSVVQAESELEFGLQEVTLWIDQNLSFLVNFWFLGVLLFLFRLVNSLSEIRNLQKSSSVITDFQLQRNVYRLAGKMGIKPNVQLRTTNSGISPLTFGALKPIILLPAGLLLQLSPAQLEAIIAHELAHVKRNDYLINLLLSGLEVIFFFHPCYWWMNNTLKELRENAADDLVLKVGVDPKNLATSLAEVVNFAKQNPPELALAAGNRRNPTLQRIKRIMGYPAQNYPQNPIISIPMLLTLFLSVGLMASAQQDATKQSILAVSKEPISVIEPTFPGPFVQDTTIKKTTEPKSAEPKPRSETNRMVFTDDHGNRYQIIGDLLISGSDTIVLSPKAKASLDNLRSFNSEKMPHLELPLAPVFPVDMTMAPIPGFDFGANMPVLEILPPVPPMDMAEFPIPAMDLVFPDMPSIDMDFKFPFNQDLNLFLFAFDTTKMSKSEKERWLKEMNSKTKEFDKSSAEWEAKFEREFQPKLREFEIKMKEWEAANGPRMKEFEQKMAEWQAAHGPKMEEFESKMNEWHEANKPKMKEFEQKMKEWQATHEPKMKEFELKMKEWEAAQQPKMEEFQRKMEAWQKEHQSKLQEFQKLIQQELKKNDNR
jgi:bla regulator protein blaR1